MHWLPMYHTIELARLCSRTWREQTWNSFVVSVHFVLAFLVMHTSCAHMLFCAWRY